LIKVNNSSLIYLLFNLDENVQQAINKYKQNNSTITKNFQKNRRKIAKTDDITITNIPNKDLFSKDNIIENKKKFDELIDIASKLTELSFFSVYSDTIKKIEKDYEDELNKPKWYYKTTTKKSTEDDKDIAAEEELFGPFDKDQIKEWANKV